MGNCANLIKAIDAYLAKADDTLFGVLNDAGFANAGGAIRDMSILEERIAAAFKRESAYILARAGSAIDLETFVQDWASISAGNNIDIELADIFFDNFSENMPKLASAYIKQIDPALTIQTITARTTAWARSWSEELGELMKLSTYTAVENMLTTTLAEGDSIADFIRKLMDSGIRDEYYRARRVSLTETLRAHSVAQQEACMQNPAVEDKEWVHTGEHRNQPRENHVAMDGVKVRKDEPFVLLGINGGTYYPMYPRDSSLPAEESVNCHCIHRGIVNENVLGLSLEERQRLQQELIDADDGKWEQELDAANRARAGIE